jgi:hypothetical protein
MGKSILNPALSAAKNVSREQQHLHFKMFNKLNPCMKCLYTGEIPYSK